MAVFRRWLIVGATSILFVTGCSAPGGYPDGQTQGAGAGSGREDASVDDGSGEDGGGTDDEGGSGEDGSGEDGSNGDGSDDGTGGNDGEDGDGGPLQPPVGTDGDADGPGADEDWATETADAVAVVDAFWSSHWNDHFTGAYQPPQVFGAYVAGSPEAPRCGDEAAAPGNAFYCPRGDFIAWDVTLMRDGHAQGDSWVYLVVAHEWAHAVQRRVSGLRAVAAELQADCLAGATLFGADDLVFEEGDGEELAQALTALADETPWTRSEDHGDARQRTTAFSNGGSGGVDACLPR
ncbi:neutral zinc metallopeptidase [Streptomyces lavendulocolor]|uniref:neutral zinc metallopeptidase n=1 Tax=Streptomyces lavendulocolor TaxID=67316 RepID=UPI003C2D1D9D